MTTRTPEQAVQHQLDAYNDHDLPRFLEVYEEDVVVYRLPSKVPAFSNLAQLAEFHRTQRFHLSGLRAELKNRIVIGNIVIDHERVHGIRDHPFEVAASYQVGDGRIRTVWFFSGD